jgi:hypothetical protein
MVKEIIAVYAENHSKSVSALSGKKYRVTDL